MIVFWLTMDVLDGFSKGLSSSLRQILGAKPAVAEMFSGRMQKSVS